MENVAAQGEVAVCGTAQCITPRIVRANQAPKHRVVMVLGVRCSLPYYITLYITRTKFGVQCQEKGGDLASWINYHLHVGEARCS